MKIYSIVESEGYYSDCISYVQFGFINEQKAKDFVEKYNNELKEQREKAEKCQNCLCHHDNPELQKCYKESEDYPCENMIDSIVLDTHDARIKEIDILDLVDGNGGK